MLHAAWPPLACLTLFVVVVIILILKFGHRCFGVRVTTLPQPWERGPARYQYDREVLDTSAAGDDDPDTQLKQPLDPRDLEMQQPSALAARHGSLERMEVIDTTLRYGEQPDSLEAEFTPALHGSREEAV